MELVIGIDLATSGAKCVVMDKDAQVLAVAFTPYPLTLLSRVRQSRIQLSGGQLHAAASKKPSSRPTPIHGPCRPSA